MVKKLDLKELDKEIEKHRKFQQESGKRIDKMLKKHKPEYVDTYNFRKRTIFNQIDSLAYEISQTLDLIGKTSSKDRIPVLKGRIERRKKAIENLEKTSKLLDERFKECGSLDVGIWSLKFNRIGER